ncbi:MAG: hypothetical protein ABI274_15180, partial [Ktedonobacterales bacterium]
TESKIRPEVIRRVAVQLANQKRLLLNTGSGRGALGVMALVFWKLLQKHAFIEKIASVRLHEVTRGDGSC